MERKMKENKLKWYVADKEYVKSKQFNEFYEKEIKKYKVQMRKELPDTLILKMKREMRLFPNLYIILKKLKGKF